MAKRRSATRRAANADVPESAKAAYDLGIVLAQAGDTIGAETALRQAVRGTPAVATAAATRLGELYEGHSLHGRRLSRIDPEAGQSSGEERR